MYNRSQNPLSDVPNRHWITESVPAAAGELGRVGFCIITAIYCTGFFKITTTTTGIFNFGLWSDFSSSTAAHFYGVTERAKKHFLAVFYVKIQKAGKFMSTAGRYMTVFGQWTLSDELF